MTKEKLFKILSIVCLCICVLVWFPNIVFQVPSPFWLLIYVIAPIGILFAALVKNYWLIIANTFMFFSFFIFMFVGYFVNFLTA